MFIVPSCRRQQRAVWAEEPSGSGGEPGLGKSRADAPGQSPAAGPHPLPRSKHAQRSLVSVRPSLPGSTQSLAHTHQSPAEHKKNTGRGPQCPPPPSSASPAPRVRCPHRSGLKRGLLPLGGRRGPPGPPAVRAGTLCREGLTSQVPVGTWGLQAPPELSHAPPNVVFLQLCSVSPTTAWACKPHAHLPRAAPPERQRTPADQVPSALVASKKEKKKETGF